MDIFYKPPLQRPDECRALEENYMNCLMQKALKDKVLTNKCVMDSLLWFHLECPKAAVKFDDPLEFKRKFRNFFALQKASAELLFQQTDEEKRIKSEFGHTAYPEDIKEKITVRQFPDEFKHLSPVLYPESADDFETEVTNEFDEELPIRDRAYGKPIPGFEIKDISVDDSKKFSGTF